MGEKAGQGRKEERGAEVRRGQEPPVYGCVCSSAQQRALKSWGTGLTDGCKLTKGGVWQQNCPLEGKPAPLPAEPPLQPLAPLGVLCSGGGERGRGREEERKKRKKN